MASPLDGASLTRAERRLLDELDDDGVSLDCGSCDAVDLVQELDHVRRPPRHEGKQAVYGGFVLPRDRDLVPTGDLVELIELELPLAECRRFADGRSTFVVRRPGRAPLLACFRRSVQYEADLVDIQAVTGAAIVQRTVLGVPRLFVDERVIEWDGRNWSARPTANALIASVADAVVGAPRSVLEGILDLCVHWLSPSRVGATLLYDFDPRLEDAPSLDLDAVVAAPGLSVLTRHHYPALFAALMQTDLATLVGPDGSVNRLAIGLRSSIESEQAVAQERGMRHRSAARYTWDHHHTVAFVVSADGPVTVFWKGRPITECTGSPAAEARDDLGA